MQEVI